MWNNKLCIVFRFKRWSWSCILLNKNKHIASREFELPPTIYHSATFQKSFYLVSIHKKFNLNRIILPDILQSVFLHHGRTEDGMLEKFWDIEEKRVDKNWERHMPGFVLLPGE